MFQMQHGKAKGFAIVTVNVSMCNVKYKNIQKF